MRSVAPFAGAWIEITGEDDIVQRFKSLPSRERGLKCKPFHRHLWSEIVIQTRLMYAFTVAPFAGAWIEIGSLPAVLLPSQQVAPFAGAWIEISMTGSVSRKPYVAPFAGAWIEITADGQLKINIMSLPSRERGLKFRLHIRYPWD